MQKKRATIVDKKKRIAKRLTQKAAAKVFATGWKEQRENKLVQQQKLLATGLKEQRENNVTAWPIRGSIRTVEGYSNIIVIRHFKSGFAQKSSHDNYLLRFGVMLLTYSNKSCRTNCKLIFMYCYLDQNLTY
ncbi:hypothetical protein Tco_1489228 [Tanacetum coccineum]